ncbi:TauD/TfdA family dioxygenase [Pelagibius sp. Alg239-R121]|uniref:TauD/TfdA family dioxygenase n=1 Tax=Pelagibius sp. Alg239-R121 TaxID=2993448 RepID=UPI0024A78BFD|nr:TauD/TfdA family dioxygenase [Pelagibius sp. Alg239-R121]
MIGDGARFSGTSDVDPAQLEQAIKAPCAWHAADLTPNDWIMPIPANVMAELDNLAGILNSYGGSIEALTPDRFALSAATELMDSVRTRVNEGVGFAVLDRLPVERWGDKVAKAVAWVLTSMLGPVVMQKVDGTRLYEVKDSGAKLGYGVRRSITNLDQDFHTDGGWLSETPEITTLVCMRPASSGGLSRVASLATAHNQLRGRHPDLLGRLYRPFWWDRQAEHLPEESKSSRHPVFAKSDGKLTVRHYDDYVRKGYKLLCAHLDQQGDAALVAMKAIVNAPENWIEFRLEPGQIEYVNNHVLAHARTAFEDDSTNGGRYLLRLWNRRAGGIELEQSTEAAE